MKVFAVTTQKGGAGKTTTCAHLGVELSRRGYRVVLVDTDPHANITSWWEDRKAEQPGLLAATFAQLPAALEQLDAAGMDFAIIDTSSVINKAIVKILNMADLAIVPSKVGPLDMKATRETLDIIRGTTTPMIFLLNEVRPNTVLERDAMVSLSRHGTLAPVIHYRQQIISAMIDGRTCGEISRNCAGAKEVRAFTDFALEQVGIFPPKKPRKQQINHALH